MADKSPQDELMPFTKLKQFLGHAEAEPRGCALALSKDKKDVLILIGDKSAKPKKVSSIMKKKVDGEFDPNLLRFGRVSFDMERDKGTVRFDLNKNPAGGMIALTVKLMKKAGYESAVFNEVPSLEDEGEEDIPDAPPPPPVQPVIDADALKKRLTALVQRIPGVLAADPTRKEALLALAKQAQLMLGTNNLKTATKHTDDLEAALGPSLPDSSVPPPPPPPPPQAQTIDAGALKQRLTGLVQRMSTVIAGQPALKDTLVKLAKDAQVQLATNNLKAATGGADALESALDAAVKGGKVSEGMAEAPRSTDGPRVAFAKSSQLWRACRSSVNGKMEQLKTAVIDAYADEPDVQAAIRQNIGKLSGALDGLDDRLDDALDDALNAGDDIARAKAATRAKQLIADYIKTVASSQKLAAIDDNPFGLQVGLKETLSKTLSALVGLSKSMV